VSEERLAEDSHDASSAVNTDGVEGIIKLEPESGDCSMIK